MVSAATRQMLDHYRNPWLTGIAGRKGHTVAPTIRAEILPQAFEAQRHIIESAGCDIDRQPIAAFDILDDAELLDFGCPVGRRKYLHRMHIAFEAPHPIQPALHEVWFKEIADDYNGPPTPEASQAGLEPRLAAGRPWCASHER